MMQENSEVIDAGTPKWIVTDVVAQPDYCLEVTFVDGMKKLFDCKPLLARPFYAALNDPELFAQARVMGDSVGWPGEIDIAPEILYAAE